jgi:hypothetical protein
MSNSQFQSKGVLDHLASPMTILPIGAGVTLAIVGWVLPQMRTMLFFLGGVSAAVGVVTFLGQVLFSRGDPRQAEARKEFGTHLEAVSRLDAQVLPQEAKLTTTPALAERP